MLSIQDLEEKRRPILEALIARQGDAAGKARVAGEFYDSLSRSAGGGVDEFRGEILGGFPDAESRMNHVIATAKANGRAVDRISEELKALGHSEDEVARFREAAGK